MADKLLSVLGVWDPGCRAGCPPKAATAQGERHRGQIRDSQHPKLAEIRDVLTSMVSSGQRGLSV